MKLLLVEKLLVIFIAFCVFGMTPAIAEDGEDYLVSLSLAHSRSQYPAGGQYSLALQAQIAPGYHINSNQPDSPDLIPTRVSLSGAPGISLSQVRYPPSAQHVIRGEEKPIKVWDGQVEFVALIDIGSQVAPGGYDLVFTLFYQACDDQMCQMPASRDLGFTLEVASPDK